MNDKEKQRLINDYLSSAERIQQQNIRKEQHQKNLEKDKKIFEQVVEDMGLSPEAQMEIKQFAEDSLNTAQDHYFKNELKESIKLAEKSRRLMPYDLRPMELLLRICLSEGPYFAPQKAEKYAKKILQINPSHKEALQYIRGASNKEKPSKSYFSQVFFSFAVAILVILSFLCGVVYFLGSEPVEPISAPIQTPQKASQEVPKKSAPAVTQPDFGTVLPHPPIEFLNNNVEGLEVQDRGSKYSAYKDAFGYKLMGVITNNSNKEIKGIVASLELLDGKGNSITKKKFDLRQDYRPDLRTGESYGFDELIFQKGYPDNHKHPQKIRVTFESIQSNPAAKKISKKETILNWEGEKPEQFNFRVMERSNPITKSTFSEDWRVHKTYEITNLSEGVTKHLKLKLEALDETGAVVGKNEAYLISTAVPPMQPNETRLALLLFKSLKKPTKLRLTVIECR